MWALQGFGEHEAHPGGPAVRKSTTRADAVTIGIDLGDRRSEVCVLDNARGAVVERFSVETTTPALERRMRFAAGTAVVVEAGTHSPWVSRLLARLGLRVTVANPSQVALISRSHRKTDRVD